MSTSSAGKGDRYRKVDRVKYDTNYVRIFGKPCPMCHGTGDVHTNSCYTVIQDRLKYVRFIITCPKCYGLGKVERKR